MVYFLVDGGMGDSVQLQCQNVSNVIANNVQHISTHFKNATTISRIVQQHHAQKQAVATGSEPEHDIATTPTKSLNNAETTTTTTTTTQISTSSSDEYVLNHKRNNSAPISTNSRNNIVSSSNGCKNKIKSLSLDESDEDEIALYPLSNQVSLTSSVSHLLISFLFWQKNTYFRNKQSDNPN